MQGQNHIKFVCLCVYLPDDGLIQVETCGRDISDKQLYIIDLQYVVLIRCIDGQVSYCWSGYCSGQSKYLTAGVATALARASILLLEWQLLWPEQVS